MTLKKFTKTILTVIVVGLLIGWLFMLEQDPRKNGYIIKILERSVIYAVVAVAMNLMNGFTGLFSLGQAGFMALGAYTVGILTIPVEARANVYYISGIAPWLEKIEVHYLVALILGGVIAAIFAALIGVLILKLRSDYLAIATLGFAEIIRSVIASPQMDTITNGSYGLKKILRFDTIFTPFILAFVCILIMVMILRSSYGRAFMAIREDEIAAEAMGINLFKHKELSFVISSFFTGVAGGMLAMFMGSIDSATFRITLTYDILLIVVLGGLGSVSGSILAAFLVTAGREWLRFFDEPLAIGGVTIPLFRPGFRMVIFSILLMLVVLFYRRGIMGDKEFSWDAIATFFVRLGRKKGGQPVLESDGKTDDNAGADESEVSDED